MESPARAFAGSPEVISPTLQQIIEENAESYPSSLSSLPPMPLGPSHEPAWFGSPVVDAPADTVPEPMWLEDPPTPVAALPSTESETPHSNSLPATVTGPSRYERLRLIPAVFSRWRLYAGVGVAVVLAIALFAEWRATRGLSTAATPAISPPTSQPAVVTPPAHPAKRQTNRLPRNRPATEAKPAASAPLAATDSGTPPPTAPPAAVAESGSEDLAMAQRYLNGTHGAARDSSEAAKWLWKAVAKKNMAATLLLSDLYLRGDGVPRSCDQARLLLDAAAQKGGAEAEARLRNMEAFGCQ